MNKVMMQVRGPYTQAHTVMRVSKYYERPTAERLYEPLPQKPKVEIGLLRKFNKKPWYPQPAIFIFNDSPKKMSKSINPWYLVPFLLLSVLLFI